MQQGFIAALMLCTFAVLLFAFARVATALLVSGGLFAGLKFIAVMKLRYLDSQLMPSDFVYLRAQQSARYACATIRTCTRWASALAVLLPPLLYLAWRWDWRMLAALVAAARRRRCASAGSDWACWRSGVHAAQRARLRRCIRATCGRNCPTMRS